MERMYKAHCTIIEDGQELKLPPVKLENGEDAVRYLIQKKPYFKEVVITDEEDYCVAHAVDGKIVFPKEYEGK